jgi:hypothetical protein
MTEARGDSERTRAFLEEAVETFRSTDDAWRLAIALTHLAGTQPTRGEALRLNQEAIDVAQAAGDARNVSLLKHNLGYLTEEGGNDEQAEALHEESLAGTRAIGDVYGTSATLGDLARLALRRGESRPRGTRLATSSKDHGWRGRSSTLARRSTSRSSGSTPHES